MMEVEKAEIAAVLDITDDSSSLAEDDNDLALQGIKMLLNNKWPDSVALFEKYKSQSSIMHFGSSFVSYMQAMMSLEEEKIAKAKKALEELEHKCDTRTSIIKRIKKKVKKNSSADEVNLEDKWTSQIIRADCLLCQAVLTFINQDIPSYVKGGWLLRKAWKVYEKVHADIQTHYEQSKKSGAVAVDVTVADSIMEDEPSAMNGTSTSASLVQDKMPSPASGDGKAVTETMTLDSLSRLLGGVSFGFGLFQLGLSMIPDKVLKLIEFLGFEANREAGLKALEFSSNSLDMRAPLSGLSLLWYHTIMKPFFTSSNELSAEELEETIAIIEKYQAQYPESSLFLFFQGRICRLQKDIDGALKEYIKGQECANGQVELSNALLFEISWCNMMKLNYEVSYDGFTKLLVDSKWSKCFYTYMQALCGGSLGRLEEAGKAMKTVPGLMKKKSNQIEAFVSRRAQQFKKIKLTQDVCQMLVLEIMYMWNNLGQCSGEDIEKMLAVCSQLEEKKFFHLRSLVEGALYKQLGDEEFGMQCLKEALARHEGLKYDYHIAAHALFEMGVVHIKSEDTREEGRKMLLKAKDGFKEYDFENRLNIRIRSLLKSMS